MLGRKRLRQRRAPPLGDPRHRARQVGRRQPLQEQEPQQPPQRAHQRRRSSCGCGAGTPPARTPSRHRPSPAQGRHHPSRADRPETAARFACTPRPCASRSVRPRSRTRYSTNLPTSRSTGSLTTATSGSGTSPQPRRYATSCRSDVGENHCFASVRERAPPPGTPRSTTPSAPRLDTPRSDPSTQLRHQPHPRADRSPLVTPLQQLNTKKPLANGYNGPPTRDGNDLPIISSFAGQHRREKETQALSARDLCRVDQHTQPTADQALHDHQRAPTRHNQRYGITRQ